MSRKTSSSAPCWSYRAATSAGSPASRRSTNRVPLTTRPSLTSRHGMIRLASIVLSRSRSNRVLQRESALIESLSDQSSDDTRRLQLGEPSEVIKRRNSTRRNDRVSSYLSQSTQGVHVRPREHPVPLDVGIDNRRQRQVGRSCRQVGGEKISVRRPTPNRDLPVLGIDSKEDATGVARARRSQKRLVLNCRSPKDSPLDAGGERLLQGSQASQPAAKLYWDLNRLSHLGDNRKLLRRSGKSAVKIDQMQDRCPLILPPLGHSDRIGGIGGLTQGVALRQPNDVAPFQVNRGNG